MSEYAFMTRRNRFTIWTLALALLAPACGGDGESDADRSATAQMLERLGRSPAVAECMVNEFEGTYAAEDFQPLIDGRGDYGNVDFQLLEDMAVAERECTEDDESDG